MGQALRVLHVEDNESDGLLLRRMLSKEGFDLQYQRVETSDELAKALRSEQWDIVISDYSLPSFSGQAALKLFREFSIDIPFILISGTVGEDIAVAMMKAGAHDYVMKDQIKRLIPAIHRELHEAEVRRQRRLAESQLLLTQFAVDKASMGITWTDAEGTVVYMNDFIKSNAGLAPVGDGVRKLWHLFPMLTADVWQKLWNEVRSRGVAVTEIAVELPPTDRWQLELTLNHVEYEGRELAILYVRDVTEQRRAQEQLLLSLKEKEIMLKEIHHRVKNNLQIVSSLLSLQAPTLTDPRAIDLFRDSQNRIRSMSLVHENLYQSENLAKVDFKEYLRNVTADLMRMYNVNGVSITVESESVHLEIDTAVPVGLIVNELISNAFKHAFKGRNGGHVRVVLRNKPDSFVEIVIADDGVGFPEGFMPAKADSMGMHLIEGLTRQIDGTLQFQRGDGSTIVLTFKV
jgi:two-component sensor histidine kinase/CheY-like chemotaxis protein